MPKFKTVKERLIAKGFRVERKKTALSGYFHVLIYDGKTLEAICLGQTEKRVPTVSTIRVMNENSKLHKLVIKYRWPFDTEKEYEDPANEPTGGEW